jgi:hypothetical protein
MSILKIFWQTLLCYNFFKGEIDGFFKEEDGGEKEIFDICCPVYFFLEIFTKDFSFSQFKL